MQPKCPLTDEWINNMWNIHTTEYYSVLKRKEVLQYVTTWTNLEDLSEISQSQKRQTLYDSTFMKYSISQNHKDRRYYSGCQGLRGGENGELMLNRYRVSDL